MQSCNLVTLNLGSAKKLFCRFMNAFPVHHLWTAGLEKYTSKDACRTLQHIYDGVFLRKYLIAFSRSTIFATNLNLISNKSSGVCPTSRYTSASDLIPYSVLVYLTLHLISEKLLKKPRIKFFFTRQFKRLFSRKGC